MQKKIKNIVRSKPPRTLGGLDVEDVFKTSSPLPQRLISDFSWKEVALLIGVCVSISIPICLSIELISRLIK